MDRLVVKTSHGELWLVGHLHSGSSRPSLLVVSGAFPPRDYKHELSEAFPKANVVIGVMPGMFSAAFKVPSAANISAAFDEVIATLLRDQPVVAYGVSTGCLVTLGLQAPNVRRHVLQEPFFSTAGLWPFIDAARDIVERMPSKSMDDFLRELFGIRADVVENLDYSHLLEGLKVPAEVLVGERPLEDRSSSAWPSFLEAAERDRLVGHPMVRLFFGPPGSGHHLEAKPEGRELVMEALRRALTEVG